MKNPFISIIVPIYSIPELYLRQCIESCINQTVGDLEVLLVDDGSPDNCGQICDEYANKDKRLKVIHKKNGGLVSARNTGFEAASGEWMTYLDGDDWLSSDFVEKIKKVLSKYRELDMVFFCAAQEYDNKTISNKWDWSQYQNGKIYSREENIRLSSYVLNYKSGISDVWAKVYRTQWCKKKQLLHDYRLKQGEESVDFVMRAFYHADYTLFINDCLYHYRYNDNSISKRVDEHNAKCISDCMLVINEFIESIPNNELFVKEFSLRNAYVILSIAMHTYFNPRFNMPFKERKKRFDDLLENNSLFSSAIKNNEGGDFDSLRKIAFWCVKHKAYHVLDCIGRIKYALLKIGYFRY